MKNKKLISLFMALLMVLSSVTSVFAEPFFTDVSLEVNNGVRSQILSCNNAGGSVGWNNFAPSMVTWKHPDTGKTYYAYCVNPALNGQGDGGVNYKMDIVGMLDKNSLVDADTIGNSGKKGETIENWIWGAITNGFPNKSAAELGVVDDYAAYYATKMAIWALIHDNYSDLDNWKTYSGDNKYTQAQKDKILQAMKEISTKAKNHVRGQGDSVSASLSPVGTVQEIGDYFVQEYKVNVTNATGDRYYVELDINTANSVIIDMNGTVRDKNHAFPISENFKVKSPIPSALPYEIMSTFNLKVVTDAPVCVYAEPSNQTLKGNKQNYVFYGQSAVATNGEFNAIQGAPPSELGLWTIIKRDANTTKGLSGVTFEVYNQQGQIIYTGMSDANGYYAPKITESGTYTVIERHSNKSYQLTAPTTQVVMIDLTKETTTYFDNYPNTDIPVYKEDADTGKPIPGVQFQITQIDGRGAFKQVGQTDSNGKYVFKNVPDGTYTVHEVSTVSGYILDPTPQVVVMRDGQSASLKFLNSKYPGITISKIDKQTGERINSPATFRIEQVDGTYSADVTTINGIVSLKDLPVGTYKITEKSPPEGYVLDPDCSMVYLGKGESVQYIARNLKKPTLTIQKIDGKTGKAIAGVKFEIKKTDGTIIGTVTTGTDGTVKVGMAGSDLGYLDPGTYTVTEVFVPEPYVLPTDGSQTQNVVLNAGDTKSLLFTDLEMPTIIVEKYDEQTGEKLPGAQFAIYEQADTSRPVAEGMTDKEGKFTSGYIMPGTYVVKELNPPPGYMFSDKTQSQRVIVAKAGDGAITVKVDNIKLPKLIIKKLDAVTKEPLAGVTFRVEQTDSTSFQPATAVTNAQGIIEIPDLKAGTYTVTEISVPSNYILDTTPQNVKMEAGDIKTLLFENTKRPTLVIMKTDYSTNKPVPNTTFKVEYENSTGGIELVGTYKTDTNGRIVLPFVKVGWYVITEVIPAQGMQIPSNPVTRIYLKAGDNSYTDISGGNVGGNSGNYTVTSGLDYPVVAGVVNYPLNSIVIKKSDANTGEMLSGATFELIKTSGATSGQNGTVIGTFTTDASGVIVITGLEGGTYAVRETKAPQNYIIAETALQTVNMKADGTSIIEVTFRNYPYGNILLTKVDGHTGEPLAKARFKVTDNAGTAVGNSTGEFETDSRGEILISNIAPGSYVVTEIKAPENYAINTTPKTVLVGTDGGTYKTTFDNYSFGTLIIKKLDADSKEPLANAEFKVILADGSVVGNGNGYFTTDEKGTIIIPNLPKGSYIISETKAPAGYILENQSKNINIDYGKSYTQEFYNKKMSSLQIIKIDGNTKQPLKDAQFTLYKANGEILGHYTTDGDGLIIVSGLSPGWHKAVENKAPTGYKIDETPKDFEITANQFVKLVFENQPLSSLIIKKFDATNKNPLPNATFKITKKSGEVIGEFNTDNNGLVQVDNLASGWYSAVEVKAPVGYKLLETVKDFEIVHTKTVTLEFPNDKLTSLIIKKIDDKTGAPLFGAKFMVEKQNGQIIGEYTTDKDGLINVPTLDPDYYIVREKQAPDGYILDETPKTVEVKTNAPTVLTFTNKPLSGLQIKKINSVTRNPIEGVEFSVSKMNGEKLGNFKTGKDGLIFIPNLTPGWYSVYEIKAAEGYLLDSEPKNVEIVWSKNTVLEVENEPQSGLLVIKTDMQTGKPLKGVVFDIRKADGRRVQSSISDKNQPNTPNNSPNKTTTANGDISGSYTTDANGRILINTLEPGEYAVIETKSLPGYELDTNVYTVTVTPGKQAVLRLQNKPLAGLRLLKIDAITGAPIYDTEFMVFDMNNKVVGTFYTNSKGIIDFSAVLTEGRYTLRETRASEGYYRDDTPRTVEFIAGKVTEIVWKNTPNMAQIQITKLSADDSEVNGLPAGTPLEGAIFEVYSYKSGNLVDRFVSASNGKAVSKPLPLGRYTVKEVQAPPYYQLNNKELDVTLEFATQIIKLEYTNKSANTGVSIKKTGNMEAMPGDLIRYDIKTVKNTSTVALTDFFWRDVLPVDAVRLNKIVTGTYSQSLKYKITATTNKGNNRVIADNLSTTQNNVIDCSNASLGLPSDEFVTTFTFVFGNVKAGFTCVEQPQVFVTVLKNLPNGYQFSNKADVGGKYGQEWVIGNSTWLTTIYRSTNDKLPKTGF